MADKETDLGPAIIALTLGVIGYSLYRASKQHPSERVTRPEIPRETGKEPPRYRTNAAALAALLHGEHAEPRHREVSPHRRDLSWIYEALGPSSTRP